VLMCISRATVSAVSCLVVPAFICIDLLISLVLKINDDDDDELRPRWSAGIDVMSAAQLLGGLLLRACGVRRRQRDWCEDVLCGC